MLNIDELHSEAVEKSFLPPSGLACPAPLSAASSGWSARWVVRSFVGSARFVRLSVSLSLPTVGSPGKQPGKEMDL